MALLPKPGEEPPQRRMGRREAEWDMTQRVLEDAWEIRQLVAELGELDPSGLWVLVILDEDTERVHNRVERLRQAVGYYVHDTNFLAAIRDHRVADEHLPTTTRPRGQFREDSPDVSNGDGD